MMKKRLLCITPDLKRSGAPIALFGLLRILLKKNMYDISVTTYGIGDLLPLYTDLLGKKNIILLNGLNPTVEFRSHLQNDYDIVLLNTAATHTFFLYFQNTDIPVFWWLHEAPDIIEDSFPAFPNPHLLSPNFHLFAPSAGAADWFRSHYSYDISILPVPVFTPDRISENIPIDIPSGRTLFFIPGAYSYIKGQDILLSAILSLPEEFRNRSFFIFCGYTLESQSEYKDAILNTASDMDNVLMLDELPQENVYSLMKYCHCIIAPSRIDCLPTTITEGLMLQKLCLVSDHTGISYYLKDCVNGFIFRNREELIKRLLLIISDPDSLSNICKNGHKIYTDFFSPDAISEIISVMPFL